MTADAITLRDDVVGELRRPLVVFLGAVGMVLQRGLVRREFAGADPIGKRIRWGDDPNSTWPWITIVGVRDFFRSATALWHCAY
ncbi:MAG: hypothetical protein ACT4P6_00570 [Gemmatimonadaceae bacterium]